VTVTPTRMLVVGSDEFLLMSMQTVLGVAPEIVLLGVRDTAGSVADAIGDASPDIAVLEATRDTERACSLLREVREACHGALIVVIVAEFDIELFEEATRRGALACLGGPVPAAALQALLARRRDPQPVPGHLRLVAADRPAPPTRLDTLVPTTPETPLTAREHQVLGLVAEGRTNPQISRELWLAEQTVKFHLSKIYRKLGVSNRTEASRYALLNGLGVAPAPARTSLGGRV